MSDDDGQQSLSKRDAELWEMIKKTVEQKPAANRPAKPHSAKNRSGKSGPEQKSAKISEKKRSTLPSREDFAAMLDGEMPAPPRKVKTKIEKTKATPASKPLPSYQPHRSSPAEAKKPVQGFAKRDVRNVSSGKQAIEAAIDLHGLTQREAEAALKTFIKRAHNDGKRLALVITGKGQRRTSEERGFNYGEPKPGVLRQNVPLWLDDMPDMVISHSPAHKKHGGSGALYVRLRRRKK